MEYWTRVALYGTYDGFSRSSLGDDNIHLILDNGDRVEVPKHFVKNASDFVEKNKIKLKDIIARMEGLNGLTRLEWLDDILYKFGSSYGASKYSAGYKQGKLEGEWVGQQLKDADKIRLELNKPVVPQFVADWLNENDWREETLGKQSVFDVFDSLKNDSKNGYYENVKRWIDENRDLFARAWLDGYTVEEKRYIVKIKAVDQYLVSVKDEKFLGFLQSKLRSKFTRKELEEYGFEWVFDCPGIEIEEVEG